MMGFTSLFVQMTNETIYKDKLERIYRLYLKASNKDEILNSKPINLSMHIQQINKEQGGGGGILITSKIVYFVSS